MGAGRTLLGLVLQTHQAITKQRRVVEGTNGKGRAMRSDVFGLMGILFVILKLTDVVHWSWLWVLSPIWIGTIIVLGMHGYLSLVYGSDERKRRKKIMKELMDEERADNGSQRS
jgi:Flp pilus assembly protein TadB